MNYREDVNDDAVSFVENNKDMLRQALIDGNDFDRNDIDGLDSSFHEVEDRAYTYTLMDAAFIVENCTNEETDSGLWEGQQPEEAIKTKAAFSYAADVWEKLEGIYKAMQQEFEESKDKLGERLDELVEADSLSEAEQAERAKLEDDDVCSGIAADATISWFEAKYCAPEEALEVGSEQEREATRRWLELASHAGMFAGYPVGKSYIDARCGVGYSMPEVKDFVDFDRKFAQQVPHLAGKNSGEVQEFLDVVTGKFDIVMNQPNKSYSGKVVGFTVPGIAIQDIGKQTYVRHFTSQLDSELVAGVNVKIKYDDHQNGLVEPRVIGGKSKDQER